MNQNKKKFQVDLILFFGLLALTIHKITGDALHEWIGILFIIPLLLHLCLNWAGIVLGIRKFFGKISLFFRLNFIWDILLYLVMAITILTGILISRDFLVRIGCPIENDPFMSFAHKKLSQLLIIMIGIHLGMHFQWIVQRFCPSKIKKSDPSTEEKESIK
ncbi:MAG: cytochrome b/b6 domain-containing protein [Planctomycetia bacterium]|nr:cytochrome b/b6 domain-containing protein [Planctomycetia bacterium]